jgi:hypothetical protein
MITLIILFSVLFSAETPDVSDSNVPAGNAELLAAHESFNKDDCTCKGIPLKGRVKVVEYGAHFEVKIVDYAPDLNVKAVSYGANNCGEWQFVDYGADFEIKFVDYGADFEIKYVDYAPGIN